MSIHPLSHSNQCLIGFDYGLKRIGLAVGQTITATAYPLAMITVKEQEPNWKEVNTVIQTWQPQALIVGLPQPVDGSENVMTLAVERFCQQLQARYFLPVHTIDERLSSVAAAERISQQNKMNNRKFKGKTLSFHKNLKHKGKLDAVAAQIILETWFAECL